MNNDAEMITIFSIPTTAEEQRGAQRGIRDLARSVSQGASQVAVSTIQDNLQRFVHAIDGMFETLPKKVGGLALEKVEIHAEIDGKGNIGISAIGGAQIAAKSGIKLILSRQI